MINKKYTTLSNLKYSILFAKKNCRSLIVYAVLSIPIAVMTTLISLYMPSVILDAVGEDTFGKMVSIIVGILLFKLFVDLGATINSAIQSIGANKALYAREQLCSSYMMKMDYALTEDSALLNILQPMQNKRSLNNLLFFRDIATGIIAICDLFIYIGTISILATLSKNNILPCIIFVFFLVILVFINQKISNSIRAEQVNLKLENDGDSRKLDYVSRKSADFSSAKDIRLYSLFDLFMLKGQESITALGRRIRKSENINIYRVWLVGSILGIVRDCLAYAYLIMLASKGILTASQFILVFSAITGFSGRIGEFSSIWTRMKDCSAYLSKWRTAEELALSHCEGMLPAPRGQIEIEFDNVTFRYPNAESNTIDGVSFKIRSGEKIAIVGVNGAGKTTLVKLMCGFYKPTSGKVLVNGVPINEYDRDEYFKIVSAVLQKFVLLPLSVAENVALCEKENIDREKVTTCLQKARLAERISALPKGIDTLLVREINEDATDLSGGEAQRLMLAKALYKNAPLLILDEPTAALDPISESNFYLEYNKFSSDKASVFISHRLASTRFCDTIFLLSGGVISEYGTHDELMTKKGLYYEMFETQSQYYKKGT